VAAEAKQRILARLRTVERESPPVEYRFRLGDVWARKLFDRRGARALRMPPRRSNRTDPRRPRIAHARLAEMIEEATIGCYNDSEQITGWFTVMDENLAVPLRDDGPGTPRHCRAHRAE
jgi:hypothetical protein